MSRIDELVQELCPDGVKYQLLAEITTRVTDGSHNPPKASDGGIYPMISAKNISGGRIDFDDARMLSPEDYRAENRRTAVAVGDVLLTIVGAIGRSAVVETESPMVFQRSVAVIKPKRDQIIPRFLHYVIGSTRLQRYIDSQANGAAQKGLYLKQVEKLRIPVPPLEVQREIVRVLDKFTQLEAELEAELEARRTQYEHYRDTLVSTSGGQRAKLADLGTFVRGRRFTKTDVVEVGIPSLHYGEIYTDYGTSATQAVRHVRPELRDQLRYALPGSVVFAGVGETVADVGKAVAWLGEEPIATHDDTFVFNCELDPNYVAYAVQTADFHRQKERHVSRAKVKRLSATGLGAIEIPVPSLKEQASVVRSLDKFDALVNDISVGLPAELAARRKQYEHYRDRLLTFKELAS